MRTLGLSLGPVDGLFSCLDGPSSADGLFSCFPSRVLDMQIFSRLLVPLRSGQKDLQAGFKQCEIAGEGERREQGEL